MWNISHDYTCAPHNCQYRQFALYTLECEFRYSTGLRAYNTEIRGKSSSLRIWKSILFHGKIYRLWLEGKTLSRDNALLKSSRCHRSRRVRSKVSIQRLYPGKVGNRKVWQSEESRKTLSETRGSGASKPAHSAGAGVRVFRSWENTRDIPQGRNELTTRSSESSCCRCRCNFKGVCLSGRVAVTRARENVREIFILHSFLKNIIAIVPSRTSLQISGLRDVEIFLRWQRKTRLLEQKKWSISYYRGPLLQSPLWSVIEVYLLRGDKSATEKRLVMERLETSNFIENFAGCLSTVLHVSRLVCREFVRIHTPEIDSKRDVACQRKFPRIWHSVRSGIRKYDAYFQESNSIMK